jgi:protein import protein ZIM17
MLRNIIRKNCSFLSKQVVTPKATYVRSFSSCQTLLNSENNSNGNKHGHSHNGVACSGHSHSHGHGHSHNHAGVAGEKPMKIDRPMLMIAFTCKKCDTRSSHVMSKQAYEHGTILVQCPGCKSRHLIADHLKIFSDNRIKLEDILKAQGEGIKTGTDDLVFEDIPESLRKLIGHHAKDAPKEYQKQNSESDETPKLGSDSNHDGNKTK